MILVQRVENVMRVLASIGWKMKIKVEILVVSVNYTHAYVFVIQLQFIAILRTNCRLRRSFQVPSRNKDGFHNFRRCVYIFFF